MFLKTVLLVAFLTSSALAQEVYVTIPNGQIKGRQETTYKQQVFYAFQQIPYAKPPIGNLRFMPPEPVENWNGVLDGTVNDKVCYQTGTTTTFTQTEDCLYVNVYTPVGLSEQDDEVNLNFGVIPETIPVSTKPIEGNVLKYVADYVQPGTNANLPVMFYVFGGGFLNGHAIYHNYGPHLFMDEQVIIVTVNYRTGPFGFMTTGDTVIAGNMGLKDQNLALQWVRDNIKYFGGDPQKVTLFGLSAGGASVTLHTLSEKSKGLFRAVISESGSALCPWAYQRGYKNIAYNMAAYLNPSFNKDASSQELLTFLQSKTAEEILASTNTFPGGLGRDQMVQGFMYTPVVEPNHDGAFLTQRMYDGVASGGVSSVPLLIGIMSEEQISKAQDLNNFKSLLQQYDQNPGALVNDNMHILNEQTKAVVGNSIKQIYTSGQLQNDVAAGVKYFSDMSFSRPIIHHAKLHSQFNDVYFYQFSYHGDVVTWNNVVVEGCGRVNHGEDNTYLWASGNNGNIEQWGTARDALTTRRYVGLFANFAKDLNPTPGASQLFQNIIWPKVTPSNFQYLDINDNLEIKSNPKGDAYMKWVALYESMAGKPYDTF